MREKIKSVLKSDVFLVLLGFVIVPMISFVFITVGDESPLYASISRIAWVNGYWVATFIWAIIVMSSISMLTYRMIYAGPLKVREKRIFFAVQSINIVLVFIGCIIFPAKASIVNITFVNYVHDYLTAFAWAMYGVGLLVYSIMLRRENKFLSLFGIGLMSFIIFSSTFFMRNVIDPNSYVGVSAVSEVYIINSLLIYLVVMYVMQKKTAVDRVNRDGNIIEGSISERELHSTKR